jgi:hypothetical protein
MVLAHNIWSEGALVVVVTLVGWMALIKSRLFLLCSCPGNGSGSFPSADSLPTDPSTHPDAKETYRALRSASAPDL